MQGEHTKRGVGKIALVADDTRLIRDRVVGAFLADGFETIGVDNGEEALEAAFRTTPNIIVLDLSMPVMNGLEAAFELRRSFPKTPIILSTLYAGTLSKKDALKAGITVVLPKSTSLLALIEKAHELMGD